MYRKVFIIVFVFCVMGSIGVSLAWEGEDPTAYLPLVALQDATTTPSPTPTVTPTATLIPSIYPKDEEPNLPIPHGPAGVVTSTLDIPDSIVIRELRIFVNIVHEDVGDLEVAIVHPQGIRILLHEQGQDTGMSTIRRWFPVTGAALESIANTDAQGLWRLEVQDQVEGGTGELLSWAVEVYP
jgi:subtilisin-like proprotein convertase family protein